MRVNLRASRGHYVSAPEGRLEANRVGAGAWETFLVVVHSHGGRLVHGATVSLQTHTGRFVVALNGGGGSVDADRPTIGDWERFRIEREAGEGEVAGGDRVRFRTHAGNYLVALDGGGGEVLANRDTPGSWETFVLEWWTTTLVHLRCNDGRHYLCAEGGGGRELTADRAQASTWETFEIIGRSNRPQGIFSGDSVGLRVFGGQLVEAGGGGAVSATANLVGGPGTFVIEKVGPGGAVRPGEILAGDEVAFRASNRDYLVAEGGGGGAVNADRSRAHPGPWETFTLTLAHASPVAFSRAPSAPPVYASPGRLLPRVAPLFVALVEYADMPPIDPTLTLDHLREMMFGAGRSVKRWFERCSYGALTLADAGVHALRVPLPFSAYTDDFPLNATRRSGGEWERFKIEVVIDGAAAAEGTMVVSHGQQVALQGSTTRYVTNRYYLLTASESIGPRETFVLERVAGTGQVRHGDLVAFRATGPYVAAESGMGDHLIANRGDRGPWETFKIEREAGGGVVRTGDQVFFVSLGGEGRYVCSDRLGLWPDLFNAAHRARIDVSALDIDRNGTIFTGEAHPVVFDFSGQGGAGSGSKRNTSVTTIGGVDYSGNVVSMGLYLEGGPLQGAAQLDALFSTTCHELGHGLLGLPDRYYHPAPVRGDVIADRRSPNTWERFVIRREAGPGEVRAGDRVSLQAHDSNWLVAADGGGGVVNANATAPVYFVVEDPAGGGAIVHGGEISLRVSRTGPYLAAESLVDARVMANRDTRGSWERFRVTRREGSGPVVSSDEISLQAHHGRFVTAETNERTTDADSLARGFYWGNGCGNGVGGRFDIMDDNCHDILMGAYDRIKQGWIRPRVLKPEDRGCYALRPVIDAPEAFVLWDPRWPQESYVVEYRRIEAGFDEIPSEGLIISWIAEDEAYWGRFPHSGNSKGRYPVVISAAAPDFPANPMVAPAVTKVREAYRRHDPDAAFTSGRVRLRRGDGMPSRFDLEIHPPSGGRAVFCIR